MFGLNDPFFNNDINSLMGNMIQDPFQQGNRNNRSRNNNQMDPFANMMAIHQSPFNMMNQMMSQHMGGFGNNNFNMMSQMSNGEPTQAMYSSSSVMTYSNSGDGKPKIYQASSQVRQGPGGVKETRQMLRDSEKGLEKVAVGHHIGDRAHVIERQKFNGGDVEEIVNLENLDDSEIPEFNHEFESKIASQMRNSHHHQHRQHHLGNHQPFAIEDKKKDKKSKSKSKH